MVYMRTLSPVPIRAALHSLMIKIATKQDAAARIGRPFLKTLVTQQTTPDSENIDSRVIGPNTICESVHKLPTGEVYAGMFLSKAAVVALAFQKYCMAYNRHPHANYIPVP